MAISLIPRSSGPWVVNFFLLLRSGFINSRFLFHFFDGYTAQYRMIKLEYVQRGGEGIIMFDR